ncbi:hypothetical protein ACETWP_14680 [Arthrobacter halodurans]|uniref:Uncharacterized protein n=1 Tax=Arthrobacter halodurans TaxID=516699 RepID=A0ABV4UQ99_9MICC
MVLVGTFLARCAANRLQILEGSAVEDSDAMSSSIFETVAKSRGCSWKPQPRISGIHFSFMERKRQPVGTSSRQPLHPTVPDMHGAPVAAMPPADEDLPF